MIYHIQLKISVKIFEKINKKHNVTKEEIFECFYNRIRGYLEDIRPDHQTEPPTYWFIAETDRGRILKVVFIENIDGSYEIKTAYEPNDKEVKIYEKYS